MTRKYYSIGELIDENIRLKKELNKMKIKSIDEAMTLVRIGMDARYGEQTIKGFQELKEKLS